MKKLLLTAACLFVASQASAVTLTGISMDWYDASSPRVFDLARYRTTVTGSINTTAVTGHLVCDVPFFGGVWVADVVWASETAGANTWKGTDALPTKLKTGYSYTSYSYNFNLAPGDVAVGLYFDWSTNLNTPILAVFKPDGLGGYQAVDTVWSNHAGVTGTGMQTAPFPGMFAAFYNSTLGPGAPFPNGAAPVPEPASMLLIGAGLAGLVGVARRRR